MDAMTQMSSLLQQPTADERRKKRNHRYYEKARSKWVMYRVLNQLLKRKGKNESAIAV